MGHVSAESEEWDLIDWIRYLVRHVPVFILYVVGYGTIYLLHSVYRKVQD